MADGVARAWRATVGRMVVRLRVARERHALEAIGPYARLELNALLVAQGAESLYAACPDSERSDAGLLWGDPDMTLRATVDLRLHAAGEG
jgi:hypothetical protein